MNKTKIIKACQDIEEAGLMGPPPTPDPFGNAWYEHQLRLNPSSPVNPRDVLFHFKAGWDAAIAWKEGQ